MSGFLRKKLDKMRSFATYKAVQHMTIASQAKQIVDAAPEGVVLTMRDFDVTEEEQLALLKALSRLVASGELEKVAKGKYYKPKETMFGSLKPGIEELLKDLLTDGGKTIGYITGAPAFLEMGLTTQISSAIVIGTNRYRRPIERGGYAISFLAQGNPITKGNIPLLRILDAIKLMREIPAATPDESICAVRRLIETLGEESQEKLVKLALEYTPYVRAVLGAIFESLGKEVPLLRKSLNGLTNYKLPISEEALPTKRNWNIV